MRSSMDRASLLLSVSESDACGFQLLPKIFNIWTAVNVVYLSLKLAKSADLHSPWVILSGSDCCPKSWTFGTAENLIILSLISAESADLHSDTICGLSCRVTVLEFADGNLSLGVLEIGIAVPQKWQTTVQEQQGHCQSQIIAVDSPPQ